MTRIVKFKQFNDSLNENLSADLNKDTILHILKLKIEDNLNKEVDYEIWNFDPEFQNNKIDSDIYDSYILGRKKAYKEVLNLINKFEKDS